jgi:hypothetical protein
LRKTHSDEIELIGALEKEMSRLLMRDPRALLDEDVFGATLKSGSERIGRMLVELAAEEVIQPVFLWICPTSGGTVMEVADPKKFPDHAECDRCGELHLLSAEDVEVQFLPSGELITSIDQ